MTKRRDFMRILAAGAAAAGTLPAGAVVPTGNLKTSNKSGSFVYQDLDTPSVGPDTAQKAWMELGFGLFIHFGINTYYDVEWSKGDLDISVFDPQKLDTDRWCELAAGAGMKYIVLVTKHHDGFCLWPTKHTDYSVANTPFRGDVVGSLAESVRKYGLKLGLYYSLWDANHPAHTEDEPAYVEFMKLQLRELLTQYGEVVELWFDGFWKKQQSGWKTREGGHTPPEDFIQAWRMEGAHRWQIDHLYHYVKGLQPNCIVMNNATGRYPGVPLHPVDAICGEKALSDRDYRNVWTWLGKEKYFPMQIEATLSVKGNQRFPSGNWFWHEWDHSVASLEQVRDWQELARTKNANLLLNCGPSPRGELRNEDQALLKQLGS